VKAKMVLKKILGRGEEEEPEEIDIEEYLNDLSIREGKIIERDDITYVKPVDLDREGGGLAQAMRELEKDNIVVLNVRNLLDNKLLLRKIVKDLRDTCLDLDGDLGKISDEKILIVPAGMRIVHRGS